jgi:hypothetical protein
MGMSLKPEHQHHHHYHHQHHHHQPLHPLLRKGWLGIVIILFVISYLILFGRIEWPGLHVDAPMYSTASVNVARNFGWHYGGYTDRLLWKPAGLYDHHGVLQVILYGKLLKTVDWLRYNAANTLINVLTYLLYTFLLSRVFRRGLGSPSLPLASCAALLPTLLQLGVQGRPEHLITPLIALPYLAYELSGSAKRAYLASIPIAALILLTSPMVGVMFIGLVVVLLLALHPLRKALFPIALLGGGSTLLAAIILSLATPFNLLGWLKNMASASKLWVETFPLEGVLAAYKSDVLGGTFPSFAWNWSILFLVIVIVCSLFEHRRWLALALFAFLGYYITDRASDYNYIAFLPLAWLAFCNLPLTHSLPPLKYLSSRGHLSLIVMITAIYLAWFGTYAIISTSIALSHTDASQARALLQREIGKDPQVNDDSAVAFKFMQTPSFVVLGEPFENKAAHFVDSAGTTKAVCNPGEMREFERVFNVKFRYYIHPLHVSFINQDKSKSPPMPAQLCVGGERFQLSGGPFNKNDTPLARFLPGRLKDYYSFALYRRAVWLPR